MRPNSSHTGKRRRNRVRGASVPPTLTAPLRDDIEAALGHRFKAPELLDRALTHRSAAQGKTVEWSNERLEFLGDRVLGLVVVEALLLRFPLAREGELAPRLNQLVSRETCAVVGAGIGIEPFIMADASERQNGAQLKTSLLANAMEALIGAIHQDGGMTAARKFILHHWRSQLAAVTEQPRDPKSSLQEWAQGRGLPAPVYTAGGKSGPDHAPLFTCVVAVEGFAPSRGDGPSKQDAERAAARALLAVIKETTT